MDSIYLWPDNPALSIFVIWLVSAIFLWAAREPMLRLLQGLGDSVEDGLAGLSDWCRATAETMRTRSRASLLASGTLELQGKLDREFHRVESAFSDKLGQYTLLHRSLDDLLQRTDADYKKCGDSPPEVPGWTSAVETIAGLPTNGDPNVQKVLDGIRKSLEDSEKKALRAYRDATGKRHKLLSGMMGHWKEIRTLMARMKDAVVQALESTSRIDGYVDEYEKIRNEQESAARALTFSAFKLFFISVLVLGIAFGGAFINFQLIALPMSELVPAGARIGGMPVSMVSALVIVLMEAAVGLFIMDMLGITDLFPKLAKVPSAKRRLILAVALGGLFTLAAVESSLAILREQIVEADAAMKMALAGAENSIVVQASNSRIPVIGQAVLGFVLPWILAMVAIPLEMLLDSGRHVAAAFVAFGLSALGHLARVLAHAMGSFSHALLGLYDVYISIPLRIERTIRGRADADDVRGPDRDTEAGVRSGGVA